MTSYLILSTFKLLEEKVGKRDITHSFYELTEQENDSRDYSIFSLFQNPILQETNSLFERQFSIENLFFLKKESKIKNVECRKLLSENKKERIFIVNKKRGSTGRKKKKDINMNKNNEIKEKEKFHDKNKVDNLIRKIQVHYMSFIRSFLTEIIKHLKIVKQFLEIDYNIKKDVHKKNLKELKEKTIGEIISCEIISKYKNNEKNYNKIIVDDLSKDEVLRNKLSQNYMSFFKEVYYQSNNKINLKRYGADEEIILSNKVEMYRDFIKNNDFDFIHIMELNRCVAKYFYPELIFLVNYN